MTISPSGFAEDFPHSDFKSARDYVVKTSEEKLLHKVKEIAKDGSKWKNRVLVISADTIISITTKNGFEVLEKATNKDHAL